MASDDETMAVPPRRGDVPRDPPPHDDQELGATMNEVPGAFPTGLGEATCYFNPDAGEQTIDFPPADADADNLTIDHVPARVPHSTPAGNDDSDMRTIATSDAPDEEPSADDWDSHTLVTQEEASGEDWDSHTLVTREAPDSAIERAGSVASGGTIPGSRGARRRQAIRNATADGFVPGYELLGELGRGGMGVVYKARQVALNRVVALKMVLSGGHASANDLQRFLTEAEAVAALQHPNIVQIYESGTHNGLPYFTLEFVDGGSLADLVREHPLPPSDAAAIVEQIARGVHFAHERGIVHRDLKPDNVLLSFSRVGSASDPSGLTLERTLGPRALPTRLNNVVPKITDFGLAKKVEGGSGMTQTGAIMGTPSYMAPEQADGRAKDVGPAADTWALGAILYRLLTGRPPFQAATPLDTVMQVVNEEPLPPARIIPRLPRDLDTICMKCLQKDPSKRYASSGDLADDLHRYLNDEPIRARPVRIYERWWRWARRHPSAALLLTVTVLGVGSVAVAGASYLRGEARRVAALRTRAAEAIQKGREAAASGDWQAAQAQFAQARESLAGESRLAAERTEAESLLAGAEGRVRARESLASFDRLRGEALLHAARTVGSGSPAQQQATLARLDAARTAGESALAAAGLEPGEHDAVRAGLYELTLVRAEALGQRLLGETPDAFVARRRGALAELDRAAGLGFAAHPTHAYHLRRARYLDELNDPNAARGERARAAARPPVSALDHYLVGDERYKEGEIDAAAASFETVLRIEPDHFWARYFLALCQLRSQRPDLAKAHLTACLSQQPDPAARAWVLLMRGYASGQLGATDTAELRSAEKDFESALGALSELGATSDVDAEYALYNNRGVMRVQNGRLDEGLADLHAAAKANPTSHHAHVSLAMAYQQAQRLDDAMQQLDHALSVAGKMAAAGELDAAALAQLHRTRAQVHLDRWQRQARPAAATVIASLAMGPGPITAWPVFEACTAAPQDAARADLERAIALLEQSPTVDQTTLARAQMQLGQLLQLGGRHREAIGAFDRAATHAPTAPDAQRRKAQSLLRLGRYAAGEQALTAYIDHCKMLGLKPAAEALLARAAARDRLGRPAEAADDYSQALELGLKSDHALTLSRRGRARLAADKPTLAVDDFDEAIRLGHDTADVFAGRSLARARLGRFPDALTDAEESLRHGPPAPALLHAAARSYALALNALQSRQWRPREDVTATCALRALELLEDALRRAGESAPAAWRAMRSDIALAPLQRTPRFRALADEYTPRVFEHARRAEHLTATRDDLLEAARAWAPEPEPGPERAIAFLRRALRAAPPEERDDFWLEAIAAEPAFEPLRERADFKSLRGQAARPDAARKP